MKLGTRLILLDDVLKSWAGYSYTETLELKLPSCLQRLCVFWILDLLLDILNF